MGMELDHFGGETTDRGMLEGLLLSLTQFHRAFLTPNHADDAVVSHNEVPVCVGSVRWPDV
jgi:hypothetical protein